MLAESMAANRSDIFASTASFDTLMGSKTAHFVAQYIFEESGCAERNCPYRYQLLFSYW